LDSSTQQPLPSPPWKIAFRAKQRRFDDFDASWRNPWFKPVQRTIVELSDEQESAGSVARLIACL